MRRFRLFFNIRGLIGVFGNHASRFTFHFGGHKAVVRPDPIPNSAVKHSLADGSSPIGSARVGSRQSFKKGRRRFSPAFLFAAVEAGIEPAVHFNVHTQLSLNFFPSRSASGRDLVFAGLQL